MARTTISYGIDLGTTNSEVALFTGRDIQIIRDDENFEYTPSAVWIDPRRGIDVGRRAKETFEHDPDNAKIEFKRQMGKADLIEFKATGRRMSPEELSAEVLKKLKANVKQSPLAEDITAAVITVPADFNAAQIEATNRAARLAGIEISPLLQEPVAAAMAYGFQNDDENERVRWLVYDFGGGTFDAALMNKREGLIRVENHGGDKYLGGKDIDYSIVNELFVPSLVKSRALTNFSRNNKKWALAFARLKIKAEEAKIALSTKQTAFVDIRNLCMDDRGEPIDFEFELTRAQLEPLLDPLIAKSINICRAVLTEKRLSPADIEKIILVGGPTKIPYLRERLADAARGLGIALESGIDPFTVVARGAAVFAGTQPMAPTGPVQIGEYQARLDYKAIGPDAEPLVSGQVISAKSEDLSAFTIEFVNREARPPWRSGKLGLSPDGRFMATLWAEKGRQNDFQIELVDATGTIQKITPASFPYTVGGGGISNQVLIHEIGIGLVDNTIHSFFAKGKPLPARHREVFVTTVEVRRGSPTDALKFAVMNGNQKRADRNEEVGTFIIKGTEFKRDLPAGSEVEVTIEATESRTYLTRVYVPLLDEEFELHIVTNTQVASPDDLAKQVEAEKKRLTDLRAKANKSGDRIALEKLRQIDGERLEHDVDSALAAARNDQDAGDKCASRLRDLQVALDFVEEALKWPELVAKAEEEIEFATNIVQKHGKGSDHELLRTLVREVREAILQHDPGLLNSRTTQLSGFAVRVWRETPEFWVASLGWLEDQKPKMPNRAEAERLFSQGVRAMNENDVNGLRNSVQQLRELLPVTEREHGPFSGRSTLARR
jgi:molecular chaperone DnaK